MHTILKPPKRFSFERERDGLKNLSDQESRPAYFASVAEEATKMSEKASCPAAANLHVTLGELLLLADLSKPGVA